MPAPASATPTAIHLEGVTRRFGSGAVTFDALRGIDVSVPEGQVVVLLGPSGSGKTTLLNIIGGIDFATSGQVTVAGTTLSGLDEDGLPDGGYGTCMTPLDADPTDTFFDDPDTPLADAGFLLPEKCGRCRRREWPGDDERRFGPRACGALPVRAAGTSRRFPRADPRRPVVLPDQPVAVGETNVTNIPQETAALRLRGGL